MAKIGDASVSYHWGYEVRTPSGVYPQGDSSFLLLQIAVPPGGAIAESEELVIAVNDREQLRHPLRPIVDAYRPELRELAQAYLAVERRFSTIVAKIEAQSNYLAVDELRKLEALHRRLRPLSNWGVPDPPAVLDRIAELSFQDYAAIGVRLDRAIAVPPRGSLWVECEHGSRVTVYLGGLLRRRLDDDELFLSRGNRPR
jgi:hypothetical protein